MKTIDASDMPEPPSSPELEKWLEEHHDPAWKPPKRFKRNSKGRFAQ